MGIHSIPRGMAREADRDDRNGTRAGRAVDRGGTYLGRCRRFCPFSMLRRFPARLSLLALLLGAAPVRAQVEGVSQLGDDLDRFLVRQHAAGRLAEADLTHRPLSAAEVRPYLDSLAIRDSTGVAPLSSTDRALLASFRGTGAAPGAAWANRRWGAVYGDGRHLVSAEGRGFRLVFEPLLYLGLGVARRTETPGISPSVSLYHNTRGVRGAGRLGDADRTHLFFEARVEETQRRDAIDRFDAARGTAPRLGNVQRFKTDAIDYYRATGVLGLHTRFVEARVARDRPAWGPGRTSVELSGYAAPFDHLLVKARVWRLDYATLYGATTVAEGGLKYGYPYARRFVAMHRLSARLPWNLDVAAFEAIVFTDTVVAARRSGFDPAYLNPLVLLRSAEQDRGSPDNALVGLDAAWRPVRGVEAYGQFLFDELNPGRFGTDHWTNKTAWLAGLRLADVGRPGLMMGVEAARVRPFTYGHLSDLTSYRHVTTPLGHPLGANGTDVSLSVDWRPSPRWSAGLDLARTTRGRSAAGQFLGDDLGRSYQERTQDEIATGEGIQQTLLLAEAHASRQMLPGLWLTALVRAESTDDAETGVSRYVAPMLVLRWGLPVQSVRYD